MPVRSRRTANCGCPSRSAICARSKRRPRERLRLAASLAQQAPRIRSIAALDRERRQFAQVVGGHDARRRRLDARELPKSTQRLLPVMLPLVDQAQRIERAGPQARHLADLLKQAFRPVEQSGAQVVLREREQCLFAMLGRQCFARQ